MLQTIAIIILAALGMGALMRKLHLPALIGYLIAGFLLGPYAFEWMDPQVLSVSAGIRKIALVIILMKAGLSLDVGDLRRIGRPAILLCFVPASMEILAFLLFAPRILGVSLLEAGILGGVMAAVSPAVVVPRMTRMMDERRGTKKGIPQMIVAGASADDVYVIVIFSALMSMAAGEQVSVLSFLKIPAAILLGILAGIVTGLAVAVFFERTKTREAQKLLILMAICLGLTGLEDLISGIIPFSGLLAVMALCMTVRHRNTETAGRFAAHLGKLWIGAEVFLFALVGAIVDVRYIGQAGPAMLVMLVIGLVFRLLGTSLSVLGNGLTAKERLFCAFAEIPKATVQAAIGGIPLAMGLDCGNMVLTFAVMSIVITAPVGAFAIDGTMERWISDDREAARNGLR